VISRDTARDTAQLRGVIAERGERSANMDEDGAVPEGDTVYLSAKRLHAALAGEQVVSSDFRLPQLATADISGSILVEVLSRGKHVLMRLDDRRTLHTHFRMDGSWQVCPVGQRWRGPAHAVRIVLTTANRQAVGYRLHDVALIPTTEEDSLLGHLGPDLLGADWDADEAVRRLLARPDREIGPALLDQRNLAGIGNLYKNEVLFLRGLSPWTRSPTSATPWPCCRWRAGCWSRTATDGHRSPLATDGRDGSTMSSSEPGVRVADAAPESPARTRAIRRISG